MPDQAFPTGEVLKAGTESDGTASRAYLKFDASPFVGQAISNVTLSLLNIDGPSCGTTVGAGIQVRRVTSAWSPSTVTWNSQPSNTTDNAVTNRSSIGGSCNPAPMTWDITSMARQWAGDAGDYGVVLMSPAENKSANYRIYASVDNTMEMDPPKLTATFAPVGGPVVVNPAGPDGVEVFTAPSNWGGDVLQMAEAQAHALSAAYDRAEAHGNDLAPPYVDMVTGNVIVPAASEAGQQTASEILAGTAYLGLGNIDWTVPGTYEGDDIDEDVEPPAGPTEEYSFNPQVADVGNSYGRLTSIAREIFTLNTSQLPGVGGIVSAAPWPERNKVLLTANAVTPELRLALAQRYGTNSMVIWLKPGATRMQVMDSRDNDSDSFINGGSRYVTNDGTQCTTAFAWRGTDGERYMTTAGHCVPEDADIENIMRGSQSIGTVFWSSWKDNTGSIPLPGRTSAYGDIALLDYTGPIEPTASIFVGGTDSPTKRPVRRSWTRRVVYGDLYCVGGAATGQSCNWKVNAINKTFPMNYAGSQQWVGDLLNGAEVCATEAARRPETPAVQYLLWSQTDTWLQRAYSQAAVSMRATRCAGQPLVTYMMHASVSAATS
ncbi:hypothetical protein GCM10022224_090940 [Nonomuraea antimicrobica]|uniref:Carbohydrate-binding module family 96 domain-containing protein n=2 Tax=Nonomuraea antimicrobica TaxID=561173 RepID=A0ABP7DX54_9ACTN